MALLESGDEGYEFRGDRPPDYRVGDFNVWDPETDLEQPTIGPLMAGHAALADAFDSWAQGLYPQAKCIGDVAEILAGTFVESPHQEPFKFVPPSGSKPVIIDNNGGQLT